MEIKTKFNIGDEVYFISNHWCNRYQTKGLEREIEYYTKGWLGLFTIASIHIKEGRIAYEFAGVSEPIYESEIILNKKQAALKDIAERISGMRKSIEVMEEVRARIEKMEDF